MEVISIPQSAGEGEFTERELVEILSNGPCEPVVSFFAGRVCQACGEISTYSGELDQAAGHIHGGEFVGFANGHEECQYKPAIGGRHRRPFRFCEVCQERTRTHAERRFGRYWLCPECDERLEAAGHPAEAVLHDLAERRYHEYRRLPAAARPGKEIPRDEDDWIGQWVRGEKAEFPLLEGWLPPGLSTCPVCGTIRGETPGPLKDGQVGLWKSTCLCEGPFCRRCKRNRIRRPVSIYYDPDDGEWWHVPYFAAMAECRECRSGS
jgi:hypothetical protein